jgi:hypothetical protein
MVSGWKYAIFWLVLAGENALRTKYDLSPSDCVKHFTIRLFSWYLSEEMTMALVLICMVRVQGAGFKVQRKRFGDWRGPNPVT